jgi:hypothetical protein
VMVMTLKRELTYKNRLTNQRSRAPNELPKRLESQPYQSLPLKEIERELDVVPGIKPRDCMCWSSKS